MTHFFIFKQRESAKSFLCTDIHEPNAIHSGLIYVEILWHNR